MNRSFLSLVGIVLAVGAARAGDLPNLDQALNDNAPKIVDALREKHYKNVGVLKFVVQTGKGPGRDNAGPLNISIADRLEVALILALKDDTLGIIVNASNAVIESKNKRANHLDPEGDGRKELFRINKKYFHVAWNAGEGVEPDAFLTGEARMSADRKSLHVIVQAFDRDDPKTLRTVREFDAATDLRTLTETGVTFARGAFDDPATLIVKATANAPEPDDKPTDLEKKAEQALTDLKKSPVTLKIIYGKKTQTVEASPVSPDKSTVLLRVPTPAEKDEVSFVLTNTDDETYGVVLKLNGHNTIKHEQQDALDCKKWILKGKESVTIRGFQLNETKSDSFKVATPYESELNAMHYGDNAGTITMVVFHSAKEPDVLVKADERVATISRGLASLRDQATATDLKGFQEQLHKEATGDARDARSRGIIIGSGKVGDSPVETVNFTPVRMPVLSATIRYYEPRK